MPIRGGSIPPHRQKTPTATRKDRIQREQEKEQERVDRLLKFLQYVAENKGKSFRSTCAALGWGRETTYDVQDTLQRSGFLKNGRHLTVKGRKLLENPAERVKGILSEIR